MSIEQLSCGHESTPSGCAAGYATTPSGERICYGCADAAQVADLASADARPFTGYMSSDGKTWTTWTGGKLGDVVSVGAVHPWTRRSVFGERRFIRVVDVHGQWWSGTGAPGMYAKLRKVKPRSGMDRFFTVR